MTLPIEIDRVAASPQHHESVSQLQDETGARKQQDEPILCPHCLRTASNGIKCKGLCVADSDY
jgi:hypothetical protein